MKLAIGLLLIHLSLFSMASLIVPGTSFQEGINKQLYRPGSIVHLEHFIMQQIIGRLVGFVPPVLHGGNRGHQKGLIYSGEALKYATDSDVVWGVAKFQFDQVRRGNPLGISGQPTSDKSSVTFCGHPASLFPVVFPSVLPIGNRISKCVIAIDRKLRSSEKRYGRSLKLSEYWLDAVKKIISTELVITDSLVITALAEAYNIPTRVLLTNKKDYQLFSNYYWSTGRGDFRIADSIKSAYELGGEREISNVLEKIQLHWMGSFPYEIFSIN